VPPFGAETQAMASLPLGETANIGAVPTLVGVLSVAAGPKRSGGLCVARQLATAAAQTTLARTMPSVRRRGINFEIRNSNIIQYR
jgi:hypothetical protein